MSRSSNNINNNDENIYITVVILHDIEYYHTLQGTPKNNVV